MKCSIICTKCTGQRCDNQPHVSDFLDDADIDTIETARVEDDVFDTFSLKVEDIPSVEHQPSQKKFFILLKEKNRDKCKT